MQKKKTNLPRYTLMLLLAVLFTAGFSHSPPVSAQSSHFPRPAELEPAIRFWTRIYTEVDTKSGLLHDSMNMGVVYRKVDNDREQIEHFRSRIQADLQVLAAGRRTGLTLTQQQTLDAWPAGVSNSTLAAAVNQVRFQLGQSDRFVGGLIRSGAYREHIERVARERGLPVELSALPHVESSFHPGAHSHANAAGMWQFIRATGQRFMRIDNIVDERMDPYAATYAAMSLLEYNYNLLGTWPLALTAYNQGAGGMARAVRETGSNRIEDIILNYRGGQFGFAGRNFYPQLLAVLDVERQAQALFGILQLDPAPQYDEYELTAYVEAETLAKVLGVSVQQLRFDNPALRPIVWQGGKRIPRGYTVKIQKNSINGTLASLMARIPGEQLYAFQTPDVNYVVQSGDSLSVIARRFSTSVNQLVTLNQLDNQHRIRVGQQLLLPHDTNMVTQTLAQAPRPAAPATPTLIPVAATAAGSYQVRSGDTVSTIARRNGVSEADLIRLNGIDSRGRIYAGQHLQLPGSTDAQMMTASYTDAVDEPVRPVPIDTAQLLVADADIEVTDMPQQPLRGTVDDILIGAVASADSLVNQVAVEMPMDVGVSNELAALELAADPSDYSLAADGSVEIHASETIGHFAEWAGVRAQDIRTLNSMTARSNLIVGNRLRVPLTEVSQSEFELRRRQFHIAQQENFFRNYRIQDLNRHALAANENIDTLARQRYSVPLWLLRQYNPDLDFARVRIGQEVVFPILARVDDV
jgi:membrane-bound lytic murein transglycosylase D